MERTNSLAYWTRERVVCCLKSLGSIYIFTVQCTGWPYVPHHTGKLEKCSVVTINVLQRLKSPVFMKCDKFVRKQYIFLNIKPPDIVSVTLNHVCVSLNCSVKISTSRPFSSDFDLNTLVEHYVRIHNTTIPLQIVWCLNKVCGGENHPRVSVLRAKRFILFKDMKLIIDGYYVG